MWPEEGMLPATLLDWSGLLAAVEGGPGKVDGVPVGGGEACSRGEWPGLPRAPGRRPLGASPAVQTSLMSAGLMPPHAVGSAYAKVPDPSCLFQLPGVPWIVATSLQYLPPSPPRLHLCVCVSDLPLPIRTPVVMDFRLIRIQ